MVTTGKAAVTGPHINNPHCSLLCNTAKSSGDGRRISRPVARSPLVTRRRPYPTACCTRRFLLYDIKSSDQTVVLVSRDTGILQVEMVSDMPQDIPHRERNARPCNLNGKPPRALAKSPVHDAPYSTNLPVSMSRFPGRS